jgi:hypothetical protein
MKFTVHMDVFNKKNPEVNGKNGGENFVILA